MIYFSYKRGEKSVDIYLEARKKPETDARLLYFDARKPTVITTERKKIIGFWSFCYKIGFLEKIFCLKFTHFISILLKSLSFCLYRTIHLKEKKCSWYSCNFFVIFLDGFFEFDNTKYIFIRICIFDWSILCFKNWSKHFKGNTLIQSALYTTKIWG